MKEKTLTMHVEDIIEGVGKIEEVYHNDDGEIVLFAIHFNEILPVVKLLNLQTLGEIKAIHFHKPVNQSLPVICVELKPYSSE